MDPIVLATVAATGAAVASAFLAWVAIAVGKRDSQVRATFEAIRFVEKRSLATWKISDAAGDECLEAVRTGSSLSEGAIAFMAFLNALDLLALGVSKKALDEALVRSYFRHLGRQVPFFLAFLPQFRDCAGDQDAYTHLEQFAVQISKNAGAAS